MKKSLAMLAAAAAFAMALAGCAGGQAETGSSEMAIDDQAMSIIANGLEQRWDYADAHAEDTAENLKGAVQAEIDADASLKDAKFEDKELQAEVLDYLNTLDDSMDVLNSYGYGSTEYYDRWYDVYDERTSIVKTLVDDYGLEVDESHQSTLDELTANGNSAQQKAEIEKSLTKIFDKVTFDKEDDGYGYYTYSAIIENTTDYTFNNFSITLALYDSDGVRQGETYCSVNTWKSGEKAKFESESDIDAKKVEVELPDYYDYE